MIITKSNKMGPYLNFIKDKEVVNSIARKSYVVMKETLDKIPTETTHNIINFLNTLSEEEMKTVGIKYILTIITWARKFVGKHHHAESFQAKADQMLQ